MGLRALAGMGQGSDAFDLQGVHRARPQPMHVEVQPMGQVVRHVGGMEQHPQPQTSLHAQFFRQRTGGGAVVGGAVGGGVVGGGVVVVGGIHVCKQIFFVGDIGDIGDVGHAAAAWPAWPAFLFLGQPCPFLPNQLRDIPHLPRTIP